MRGFETKRLGDCLGAEIVGLDLRAALDDVAAEALRQAFLDHQLLCIRGEPLEPADYVRAARVFGVPKKQLFRRRYHDEAPEVSVMNSTISLDVPMEPTAVRAETWHTDDSFFAEPAKATLLHAVEIPDRGGDTRFCNMYAVYETLPEETKRRIDGLKAVHSYDTVRAPKRPAIRDEAEKARTPDVVHPLVRTHPETGRKALYVNFNRLDRIVDMPRLESDALLDELYAHAERPEFHYSHKWRRGDLVVWDNRCLMHSVVIDYPRGQPRVMHRILLEGQIPV